MTTPAPDLSKLRLNRDTPPPGVRHALVRNLVIVAILVALAIVAVLYFRRANVPTVQVFAANASAGSSGSSGSVGGTTSVTANGYVVARTRASVSAKLAGRLAHLGVSEGSFVRKGEVIAQLDNTDYAAQVAGADASLASARADVVEANANRDQLEREAKRTRDIHARSPDLVSAQDVESVDSKAAQATARSGAAAARVNVAVAALDFAKASLENTYIRAPFTGTVLRKEAEVGEVVAPSVGGGLTRGAVVTMADLTTLEVEVDVNEAYIGRIRKPQGARITLDAYPDTAFRGVVRQVVPTADRQRATVQVKVTILDHDPRIFPEMGARVDFIEPDSGRETPTLAQPRIRVPAETVTQVKGNNVVWLVRDNRLESRQVDAGPVSGGYREIRKGLAGGELLLNGGVENPTEGMRVKTAAGTK
ncbi:MAG: efflux RND transporter periplasmic adaptor subunit [Gemmatimonadota bacterium]